MVSLLSVVAALFLGACGTQWSVRATGGRPCRRRPGRSHGPRWRLPRSPEPISATTAARCSSIRRCPVAHTRASGNSRQCSPSRDGPRSGAGHLHLAVRDRASGCTKESTATAKIRLPRPLGDRRWSSTTTRPSPPTVPNRPRCGGAGNSAAHRRPPAAPPLPTSRRDGGRRPAHTYRDSEKCDGEWLVLDFSWRTGRPAATPPTLPAPPGWANRWFFRRRSRAGSRCCGPRQEAAKTCNARSPPSPPRCARRWPRCPPHCTRVTPRRPPLRRPDRPWLRRPDDRGFDGRGGRPRDVRAEFLIYVRTLCE